MECCNAPDVTFPICTPTLAVSGVKLYLFLGFGSLSPCVVFVFMHLIPCSSHAFELFPRCPFCNPALLCHPTSPSRLSSWLGVELSRNGPRLVKWPWYTTGRPPVKFRFIWRSFDAPTVNRATAMSFCVLQQNPPPNSPQPI